MKKTNISMLINIHIQSEQKSYIVRNLWLFLLDIIDFQR